MGTSAKDIQPERLAGDKQKPRPACGLTGVPKGRDGVRSRHALKFKPRAERESIAAFRPAAQAFIVCDANGQAVFAYRRQGAPAGLFLAGSGTTTAFVAKQ
jgi:hypothetical protein